MKTSLERVIGYFETFADEHRMIKSFEVAPLTENIAKNWTYPLMWIDLQEMSASFTRGQVVVSLPVYILDRVQRDFSNIESVMSSTLMNIEDFLVYFQDDEDCLRKFYFSDPGSASPIMLEFEDIVCGWSMPVSIQIMDARNENEIPMR